MDANKGSTETVKQPYKPEYFSDGGRTLVRLPVTGSDTPAVTEAALFDSAKRRHGITGNLYATDDGSGKRRYVIASRPGTGTHSPLARLLLDCPKGFHVRYRDGDPLNLLPENFRLVSPWADSDARTAVLAALLETARDTQETSHARA